MQKLLTVTFIFMLSACNMAKPKEDTKTLDFGIFTIETPKTWTKIEKQGTDSYVGEIVIDNKDTLNFDYGLYPNNLYEYDPTILDSSMMKDIDTSRNDIHEIIFVKNKMQVDPDNYKRNNISWDTIDGRKAKLVYPRKTGIGKTGVYIDSLWSSPSGIDKFNLYGENIKPENEMKVLDAFKTLRFHKK